MFLMQLSKKCLTQNTGIFGEKKSWVVSKEGIIRKGRFKLTNLTDRATVILADVDSGENYWLGYPREHYVIVRKN